MPKPLKIQYIGYDAKIQVIKDAVLGLVEIPQTHFIHNMSTEVLSNYLGTPIKSMLVDDEFCVGNTYDRGTSFDYVLSEIYNMVEIVAFKVPSTKYRPYTQQEAKEKVRAGTVLSCRLSQESEFVVTSVFYLKDEEIFQIGGSLFTLTELFKYFNFPNFERCGAVIE